MKKLQLTKQAKQDLTKINKLITFVEDESNNGDFDPYYDLSSFDMLIADMGMYCDGAYGKNKFTTIREFAKATALDEGWAAGKIIQKIKQAIKLGIVKLVKCK